MTDTVALGRPVRPFTPLQRAVQIASGAMLCAALPAMFFSRHFPSELGIRVAQVAAATLAVWTAWECRPDGAFGRPDVVQRSWLTRSIWTRTPLMTLFVFFITFTATEDGILALVTTAIGKSDHRVLTVTGVGHSRKQCEHFEVREVVWLLDQALCAADKDLEQAERGDALTVFGRRSAFGLNVERYELSRPRP